jgi:hypothetical protein
LGRRGGSVSSKVSSGEESVLLLLDVDVGSNNGDGGTQAREEFGSDKGSVSGESVGIVSITE